MNPLQLSDSINDLHSAYNALSCLAAEAGPCNSEDVGNVLVVLNLQLKQLGQKSTQLAFTEQT